MTNTERQAIGIDSAAFNAATEEQRIEWAKNNATAAFGLCEKAREWLVAHKTHVGEGRACHGVGTWSMTGDLCIYRLQPDYKPTVMRWWFCTISPLVTLAECSPCKDYVEVSADYATYLQNKPDGECELRPFKAYDRYWWDGKWRVATIDYEDIGLCDRGYRWCKVKPADAWTDDASELLASIQRDLVRLAEMMAKHKGGK